MEALLVAVDRPRELVGGKAAGLAALQAGGFRTPPAMVVPHNVVEVDAAAVALAEHFAPETLAVRSSAVGEDSIDRSYAGQFESVLDVEPRAETIATAIRRVRASAVGQLEMSVLVMPMIQPDVAGIAFSRHPITGAAGVVIEAVAGVANGLAAGQVDGERWEIGVTVDGPDQPSVLDEATALRIAELATQVEESLGEPQDIEWVLADGEITLVQARPITTIHGIEPVPIDVSFPPGPWDWDATHSQRPNSPFHASFFPAAFRRAGTLLAERYGLPIGGLDMQVIGGYIHIQVRPLVGKPGAAPPPSRLFPLILKMVPAFRRKARTAEEAMSERVDREWARRWRQERRPAFEATMTSWAALDLTSLTDEQLSAHLQVNVDEASDCFTWNMTTDMAYLLPLGDLVSFCEQHFDLRIGDVMKLLAGSSPSEYQTSLGNLRGLLTDDEVAALRAGASDVGSPEFRSAFAKHQARNGSRGLGYDVSYPTLAETSVDEMAAIVAYNVNTDLVNEAGAYADELAVRLDQSDRVTFSALVAEARSTYPLREESEYVNSRIVGHLRYSLLEVGRRLTADGQLKQAGHAAYLALDEILAWLSDRRPLDPGLIERRRGEEKWALVNQPTGERADPFGPPDPSLFPPATERIMRAIGLVVENDMPQSGLVGRGLGASAGLYTGPVRKIANVEDLAKIQPGDVLVAPLTNSAWEPVFPIVGALVSEGGGLLSHPAIVAREHGLPAVTGFAGAMDRFSDGELVTVDGSMGTVISA